MTGPDLLTAVTGVALIASGSLTIWAVRSRANAWRERDIMTDQRNDWCDGAWRQQERAEKAEEELSKFRAAAELRSAHMRAIGIWGNKSDKRKKGG